MLNDTEHVASRPGALAQPLLLPFTMTVTGMSQDFPFELTDAAGQPVPGVPPAIDLRGRTQPILIVVRLAFGPGVSGLRFAPLPDDAAWFGIGTALPQGPGMAGGIFAHVAVSPDGMWIAFRDANVGSGNSYRARFNLDSTATASASVSGGPIIIND